LNIIIFPLLKLFCLKKKQAFEGKTKLPAPHGAVFNRSNAERWSSNLIIERSVALSIHSPYEEAMNRRRNGEMLTTAGRGLA
jgi:hypothetical protein